jgi:hypothetical protein
MHEVSEDVDVAVFTGREMREEFGLQSQQRIYGFRRFFAKEGIKRWNRNAKAARERPPLTKPDRTGLDQTWIDRSLFVANRLNQISSFRSVSETASASRSASLHWIGCSLGKSLPEKSSAKRCRLCSPKPSSSRSRPGRQRRPH